MDATTLRGRIALRSERLQQISCELKAELFGIDSIIDRVIETVRAWYVLPELVQRPVIVCLWGLTGTGKTQLVRLLATKLGFQDRFVEVQMDGFSHGSGYWSDSISGLLGDSGVQEGAPGILLLDEFQRFRTVNEKGDELKVQRYQDVWALLSDGRLPPLLSFMGDLESAVASSEYDRDEARSDDEEDDTASTPAAAPAKPRKRRRFALSPYEARELRRCLKLTDPLLEVMAWPADRVLAALQAFREQPERWATDYSRLLIVVTGNLDEMYRGVATRVQDCDTDADIFHRYTSRLSLIDVKKALGKRFKPEQIARLGNNHLVYPSLDRRTYERLIEQQTERQAAEVGRSAGLQIEVDASVRGAIYSNGVFPAQGTRPLFSSLQALLGAPLVNASVWALEQGADTGDRLRLTLAPDQQHLQACWGEHTRLLAAPFDVNRLKQRSDPDFRALLAVHEAGHALVYGLLMGHVPLELKINVASFSGGYNSFMPLKAESRRDVLDMICVGLAGRAAELLVFGPDAITTGAEQDLRVATADAAPFVRWHGFAGRLSRTDVGADPDCEINTSIAATDAAIEQTLAAQYERAQRLLKEQSALLARVADALMRDGELPREALAQMLGLPVTEEIGVRPRFAERLQALVRERA
ncbi:AAA family ATPase [Ramlibacter sp.]|uniref:AAA family ATPase n=1 Tax=Ramlibacter sp. TaxID=1917967 RepID=UPI0035B3E82F